MAVLQHVLFSYWLAAGVLLFSSCQPAASGRQTDEAAAAVTTATPATCRQAVADARRNFVVGCYEVHSLETLPVENAYHDVLRMDYGVQWRFVGNMRGYYSCYDSITWQLLKRRFGSDLWARVSHKADSLDYTGRWNAYPMFADGSLDSLVYFIYPRINWRKNPPNGRRVFVEFVIQPDGQPTNFSISKGVGSPYDAEALRVLRLMPRWKPGYQSGVPVRINYTIPVEFSRQRQREFVR